MLAPHPDGRQPSAPFSIGATATVRCTLQGIRLLMEAENKWHVTPRTEAGSAGQVRGVRADKVKVQGQVRGVRADKVKVQGQRRSHLPPLAVEVGRHTRRPLTAPPAPHGAPGRFSAARPSSFIASATHPDAALARSSSAACVASRLRAASASPRALLHSASICPVRSCACRARV